MKTENICYSNLIFRICFIYMVSNYLFSIRKNCTTFSYFGYFNFRTIHTHPVTDGKENKVTSLTYFNTAITSVKYCSRISWNSNKKNFNKHVMSSLHIYRFSTQTVHQNLLENEAVLENNIYWPRCCFSSKFVKRDRSSITREIWKLRAKIKTI